MLKVAKLGIVLAAVLAWIVPAAYAGVPDITKSYFVPQIQAGTFASPGAVTEGWAAAAFFRSCPNNDGASWFNNARIKVVVLDVNNNPIPNIAAGDICVLFNGGTVAQGFSGIGSDSTIANSIWNASGCPDVRCVSADAPTNASGETYITFGGSLLTGLQPGFRVRNAARKWGNNDLSGLPVFVLGYPISGKLTGSDALGSYKLRFKMFDHTGSTVTDPLQKALGMVVNINDLNPVLVNFGQPANTAAKWPIDLDSSGFIDIADFNLMATHFNHNCASTPLP